MGKAVATRKEKRSARVVKQKETTERSTPLEEKTKLKWSVKENPKRKGSLSYARFAKYSKAKTVGELLKAGGSRKDLAYDLAHNFVTAS